MRDLDIVVSCCLFPPTDNFFPWWGVNNYFYHRYLEHSILILGDLDKSAKTSVVRRLSSKS
jgi:hypothetical protein